MDPARVHTALWTALDDWRQTAAAQNEDDSDDEDLSFDDFNGGDLILADPILDRIVILATMQMLKDADDLAHETRWIHAEKYGEEIIELVLKHCPPPVPEGPYTQVPLDTSGRTGGNGRQIISTLHRRKKSITQCNSCWKLGHTSTSHPSSLHCSLLNGPAGRAESQVRSLWSLTPTAPCRL